jgi:hypothetical protein
MEPITVETIRESGAGATSAVAWPAIIAGAFTAAAVSLILLLLGSGLGLASVSPWSSTSVTAATFTVATAIWLIIMQWISSGLGGYLTGRLRSRWAGMHADEVFFRDTAHGFLAWALATIITAAFLASAAASVVGSTVNAAAAASAAAAAGAGYAAAENSGDAAADPTAYFVDSLYRLGQAADNPTNVRAETLRILVKGTKNGALPDTDRAYLADLVVSRAGISLTEAERRVDRVLEQIEEIKINVKAEADKARSAASQLSIFTFLSLLIGAFIASAAAALGGRHRDEY